MTAPLSRKAARQESKRLKKELAKKAANKDVDRNNEFKPLHTTTTVQSSLENAIATLSRHAPDMPKLACYLGDLIIPVDVKSSMASHPAVTNTTMASSTSLPHTDPNQADQAQFNE